MGAHSETTRKRGALYDENGVAYDRAALRTKLDAALRRAVQRRRRLTHLEVPYEPAPYPGNVPLWRITLKIENWLLQWEHLLRTEAKLYGVNCNPPSSAGPDKPGR